MNRPALLSVAGLWLAACAPDETIHAYGAGERTFVLEALDGAPFAASATISFPEPGRVAGQAPCNSYSAAQTVPYPWFELGPILSTKRACAALDQEQAYFAALSKMTLGRVDGEVLTLSNDAGRSLRFILQPPAAPAAR